MVKSAIFSEKRIAVIGAGPCGLTCAWQLKAAGFAPTIFEKSRGIGGRLATRWGSNGRTFDHGAQYVTAHTPSFKAALDNFVTLGSAQSWRPSQQNQKSPSGEDWIVGIPGMTDLVRPLAKDIDIRFSTEVVAIERHLGSWQIKTHSDQDGEVFDIVIVTVPAPQVQALLAAANEFKSQLEGVSIAPCRALLVSFKTPTRVAFDVWRVESKDISWIARNSSKPKRNAATECWIIHASSSWSALNFKLDPDEAALKLFNLLEVLLDRDLPEVHDSVSHSWRYALTTSPLGNPFLSSNDKTLFVGGDWCLGSRVECAYESGIAIAGELTKSTKR
ncbi:MAG: NAD(P)/FAD-dependent oxidoreductase [Alphaproteobacteria bacterium]|jgi:renalase